MVTAAGKKFSQETQRAIDACTECHQAGLTASGHALREGGEENTAHTIRVLSDCIEMCQVNANFLLRGSPNRTRTAALCADLCRDAARECEKFEDPAMKETARICTSAAEACDAVAAKA